MQVLDGRLTLFQLLFMLRGTVLTHIWGRLLVTLAIAVAVTLVHHQRELKYTLTVTPYTLIGLALSIILGFRNQTCYQVC